MSSKNSESSAHGSDVAGDRFARNANRENPFTTIELYPDGTFRWVYELNMYKNPVIVFTLWKIFFFVFAGIWAFITLLSLSDSWFGLEELLQSAVTFLLVFLGFCVFVLVVYWIFAALAYGGAYCVVFTLDDKGVTHRVMDRQFKKAQAINLLGVLAGLAAGNPTVAGANLLAATKNESVSDFSVVTSVKPLRRLHTIKVNALLEKNQVYVEQEDFDAMYRFITERCPRLKK